MQKLTLWTTAPRGARITTEDIDADMLWRDRGEAEDNATAGGHNLIRLSIPFDPAAVEMVVMRPRADYEEQIRKLTEDDCGQLWDAAPAASLPRATQFICHIGRFTIRLYFDAAGDTYYLSSNGYHCRLSLEDLTPKCPHCRHADCEGDNKCIPRLMDEQGWDDTAAITVAEQVIHDHNLNAAYRAEMNRRAKAEREA